MSVRWTAVGGAVLLALLTAGCSTTVVSGNPTSSPSAPATSASPTPARAAPASASPGSAAPSRAAPAPAPIDPATVVEEYFAAINDHDYARAWALGGDNLDSSYAQFTAGFADTAEDVVTIESVAGHDVAVDLTATQTDGTQQTFAGTYTVTGHAITHASISQVQAGSAGKSLCGAPGNPYGYNLCGNGARVNHPPRDICTYFDCIPNFWNGHGYLTECGDARYSMSGGVSGACSAHGGESRPVSSG